MAAMPVLQPLFGGLQPYDPQSISVTSWLQLFEEFCTVNGVEPEGAGPIVPHNQKRALFLSYVGGRAYEALRLDCLPSQPNEYTIVRLATMLTERYEPVGLEAVNRYNFMKRVQKDKESALDFLGALSQLATTCNFWQYPRTEYQG